MKREELLKSYEFWLVRFQNTLYQEVEKYLEDNNLTRTDFANELGVSKGYVSQILNGDFDHKLSKFIELILAIDKAPYLNLIDMEKVIELDKIGEIEKPNSTPFISIEATASYNPYRTNYSSQPSVKSKWLQKVA